MMNFQEAISAIEAKHNGACAYRESWPEHDCIKLISNGGVPFRRKTKPNTNMQNDWNLYRPTEEDMAATDWVFLPDHASR